MSLEFDDQHSATQLKETAALSQSEVPVKPSPWRSLALGLGLGIWWLAHVWLYEIVVASGWPGGPDVPEELRVSQIEPLLRLGSVPLAGILFSVAFLAVTLWAWLERKTRMDPGGKASASFWWTLRNLLRIQLVGGVFILGILIMEETVRSIYSTYLLLIVVIPWGLHFFLPLSALRPSVVASPRAAGWWKPEWPGFRPLLSFLLLGLAELFLFNGLLLPYADSWFLSIPVALCLIPLAMAIEPLRAAVLVHRLGPVGALQWGRGISWSQIGPFIALQARMALFWMVVAPPVIVFWFFDLAHVPRLAQWASGQGISLDIWGRWVLAGFNFTAAYSWLIFLPTVAFGVWLLYGRLVWLVRSTGPSITTGC